MPQVAEYLSHLITSNLYRLYEFIGNKKGCQIFKGETVDQVISKPSCWPNMIFNTRIGGKGTSEAIDNVIRKIRTKEAPPFWILTPETDSSVESFLEKNGMVAIDLLAGMSVDIENFYKNLRGKKIDDLYIIEVSTSNQMTEWLEIVSKVIFRGKKLDQELFKGMIGSPSVHFYLGTINDIPVATSMSFISNPSAGFYNIATLPEFRKRGYATAMTSYALTEAFRKSCETGILHASGIGEPIYFNMGFRASGIYKVFWMAGKEFRDY
jgi:ribosomal protein S18 acetylase RimI-like enzyme